MHYIYIYTNIHKCAYRRCQSEIYSIDYSPATEWNAYLRRVLALLARRKIEQCCTSRKKNYLLHSYSNRTYSLNICHNDSTLPLPEWLINCIVWSTLLSQVVQMDADKTVIVMLSQVRDAIEWLVHLLLQAEHDNSSRMLFGHSNQNVLHTR